MTKNEEKKANALFEKFSKNATPEDEKRIDANLDKMNRGRLAKIWDEIQLLYKLMKDPEVPFVQKIPAIAGLVYVISPVDAIPDPVPVLGLADDAAVVAVVIASLAHLLNKYKK